MNIDETLTHVLKRTSGYPGFWCIAGGWAIDLYIGRQTRAHEDLELVVLRRDFKLLFEQFQKFHPRKIISGEQATFLPWHGEPIESEVIQMRLDDLDSNTPCDLLLTPAEGDQWICRRNEAIQRPLSDVINHTCDGVPFLAPEIVLLFKAKYVREKDRHDFDRVISLMSPPAKNWLREKLAIVHPNHAWLMRLQADGARAAA